MPQRESLAAAPAGFSPHLYAKLVELESAVGTALRGKAEVVRLATACLLARGHLLIEDVPGVGKTTLAQALARAVSGGFHRLQFTSDMLPSDVLGVTIYNLQSEVFEFKPGPIFTNFLLADEINRTNPKTQSALLEAMNEAQVTIDGHSHALPRPFMVIATQNPVEHHGDLSAARIATRPFPDASADRLSGCRQRARNPAPLGARTAARRILRNARGRHAAASGRGASRDGGRFAAGLHASHRGEDAQSRIPGAGRKPARIASALPRGSGPGADGRPRVRDSG